MTNCIHVIMTSISGSGAVTISQTENVRENENSKKKGRQKGRKQTEKLQGKVGIKKEPKLRNVEKKEKE